MSSKTCFAGLELEQKAIDKLPTWPWRTRTLGTIATAILLPVILWFVERILGSVF